jgi:DNA modification methylase
LEKRTNIQSAQRFTYSGFVCKFASTNEGDIILDSFTGSSTTGLAAVMYGRKFIGVDTESKYLDLSIKRFEKLFKQKKLEGWE